MRPAGATAALALGYLVSLWGKTEGRDCFIHLFCVAWSWKEIWQENTSLSPDTLKGMHQWWSGIASLNLVIFGGTGCHKEKHHKSTETRPQRSYYCLKTRSVWQEMILFSKSGLHWWCHVWFRGKWWTYKVYPATGRTLSLQQCSRLCSWSCCCGPVMKGWTVAALKSDLMLWSANSGTQVEISPTAHL